MTNLTLDETEEIAKQYCNGNLSKFIRDLIMDYHHRKQQGKQEEEKTDNKISIFQNTMFLFLGVALLLFGMSQVVPIDILTIIATSFLLLSGFFLFLYAVTNILKNKKTSKAVIRSI